MTSMVTIMTNKGSSGPILSFMSPVNLKFCFEGMEESGSEGLDELIFEQKDKFLKV